jgi:hypothetical protein
VFFGVMREATADVNELMGGREEARAVDAGH